MRIVSSRMFRLDRSSCRSFMLIWASTASGVKREKISSNCRPQRAQMFSPVGFGRPQTQTHRFSCRLGYPTAVSPAAYFRFVSAGHTGRLFGVYATELAGFRRQVSLSVNQTFSTEMSSLFSSAEGAQGTVSRNVECGRPFSALPR